MSTLEVTSWLHAGSLEQIRTAGVRVIKGPDRPIAVFPFEESVKAVDNRCPHLGFPLHKGTVQKGVLTCHWHYARFDLCSGCTFDLWADDVPAYDVELRGEEVFVSPTPRGGDPTIRHFRRLREGMEQNISLIQAKSIIALMRLGVDYRAIVREIALFGARYRDSWGSGLTILGAMANLIPHLEEETAFLALTQGARRVAADCAGMAPRRDRHPLETDEIPTDTLVGWMKDWTTVRHRDGAERTVLTAVQAGATWSELTRLIFTGATERLYADTGHALDFCNKAFEVADLIGREHAPALLPTVLGGMVSARGADERNDWRYPIDLLPLVKTLEAELPTLFEAGRDLTWTAEAELGEALLAEDPVAVLASLRAAISAGARAEQLGKSLCYAAASRIARFGTANEFGDWITALHTFTFCNAVHQSLKRCSDPSLVRGVIQGAMSVYLDRFLNIPPARLPGERDSLDNEPTDGPELLKQFLTALDQQQQVDLAARAVARYLDLGHPVRPLYDALTLAVVREDADFHTFQVVEAGIRQHQEWPEGPQGRRILLAAARYIAAHSPTQRAQLQTALIALRLHRGDSLYEDEESHS